MRSVVAIMVLLGTSMLYAADPNYQIIKEIQIGGEGGWDYLIVDSSAHRVYVSHATKIVVADTETGQIVGDHASSLRSRRVNHDCGAQSAAADRSGRDEGPGAGNATVKGPAP